VIQAFVQRFDSQREVLLQKFRESHPKDYMAIVRAVVELLSDVYEYDSPDPERIHQIDDGDYQGTLLFVVGAQGYQPSTYWAVTVGYGSCSGCDTLEAIRDYSDGDPTEEQAKNYLTLALDILRGLKRISGYGDDNEEVQPCPT
jgi:hypothetical protein